MVVSDKPGMMTGDVGTMSGPGVKHGAAPRFIAAGRLLSGIVQFGGPTYI